uniref:Uncharacterized protein n=1 Tax=Anguilla anguilla TaxID=7936 RepID=A0A0E9XNB5_ANGAN
MTNKKCSFSKHTNLIWPLVNLLCWQLPRIIRFDKRVPFE